MYIPCKFFANLLQICDGTVRKQDRHTKFLQIPCKFAREMFHRKFARDLRGRCNFHRKSHANLREKIFLANLREVYEDNNFFCNSVANLSQICKKNFRSQISLATGVFSCSVCVLFILNYFKIFIHSKCKCLPKASYESIG